MKLFYKRKCVGAVSGDTFKRTLRGSVHFLRVPFKSLAHHKSILRRAREAGAIFVEVRDAETGEVYKATIDHIEQRGFDVNRGHGEQVALPLNLWTTRNERC